MNTVQFAGTHRLISLREANEQSRQVAQVMVSTQIQGIADGLKPLMERTGGEVFVGKDGDSVVLRAQAPRHNFELSIQGQVIEENGQVGQEVVVEGTPEVVAQIDQQFQDQLAFTVFQLNESVTERKPGEEASYTYTA